MRRKKNPKYIAAGAHEYGHAQIASNTKYPRARVVGNALGQFSDVAGLGAGLLARRHLGRLGGSIVGGMVSGGTHIPTLIEEHSASKRALKALKDSGEMNDAEYLEAKGMLDQAYKSYVSRALGSAATSAGAAGGHAGILTAGLSGRQGANKSARQIVSQIEGTRSDAAMTRRLGNRMGQRQVRQVYGSTPTYVSPYKDVSFVYKDRADYLRSLKRAGIRLKDKDLTYGAITLPHPR